MPAGEIAQRLGVPAPTLSFHLKELERAGLIGSTRRQRQILYATNYAGTRALLGFLMHDCCQGHPEICGASTVRKPGRLPPTKLTEPLDA